MRKETNLLDMDVAFVDSKEFSELREFSEALGAKIELAKEQNKECVATILEKIKKDVEKYVTYYEESSVNFGEAYEEITALYVFSEIYVTID